MAKHALNAAVIYVGNASQDLSDHVESVELVVGQGNANVTAMGDGWEDYLPSGIKHWSVKITFLQDYSSSEPYDILYDAMSTGVVFLVGVKPTTATCSATNPLFNGSVVFDGDVAQVAGGVGDANKVSVTLKGCGTLSYTVADTCV